MSDVTVTTDGAVATIALTAPSGINGLSSAVRRELLEAFIGPALEPQVRAVVLRGVGRTFCVGQDLTELAGRLEADPSTALEIVASEYNPLIRAIRAVPVPVVAGVNGPAAGAGIGLALSCDVVVLSDVARLTFAFAGVGLAADSGLHATLTEAVGARRARALLMLNAPLDASEALAAGLADALVPAGEFDEHLTATAARLAAGPTAAFVAMKTIITAGGDLEDVLDAEAHAQMALGEGHDHGAAVRAFLAKRTPTFLGR